MNQLKFKKLSEKAKSPRRYSAFACGADLHSAEKVTIHANGYVLIKTDIAVQPPPGHYARLCSRSGLALSGVHVVAGTIDPDYIGNIKVLLLNVTSNMFVIEVGDRICQLICEKFTIPEIVEVDELLSTDRGDAGFGSTGGTSKRKYDD